MPRLPSASREDLLEELADIRRDRDQIVGAVSPERAEERRATLDRWERDLLAQLDEMDKGVLRPELRMSTAELEARVDEWVRNG